MDSRLSSIKALIGYTDAYMQTYAALTPGTKLNSLSLQLVIYRWSIMTYIHYVQLYIVAIVHRYQTIRVKRIRFGVVPVNIHLGLYICLTLCLVFLCKVI